jgi:predicted ArsR family transcriptional regulator
VAQTEPSARQREVMRHAADGKTVPEIAKAMKITPSGVRDHVRKLLAMGVDVQIGGKPYGDAATNGQATAPAAPAETPERMKVSSVRFGLLRDTDGLDDVIAGVVRSLQAQVEGLSAREHELTAQREALDAELASIKHQALTLESMIDAALPTGDGAPALTGTDAANLATAGAA